MMRLAVMAMVAWQAAAQPAALVSLADRWASEYGVPRELVHAVIEAESNWKTDAISPTGAVGLMQLMPGTAAAFGVRNRFDAGENVRGGVAYLAFLLRRFDGDLRLAVAAYNAGHGRVGKARFQLRTPETVAYTHRVAHLYRRNRWASVLRTQKEVQE